jgi:hypothetical protein
MPSRTPPPILWSTQTPGHKLDSARGKGFSPMEHDTVQWWLVLTWQGMDVERRRWSVLRGSYPVLGPSIKWDMWWGAGTSSSSLGLPGRRMKSFPPISVWQTRREARNCVTSCRQRKLRAGISLLDSTATRTALIGKPRKRDGVETSYGSGTDGMVSQRDAHLLICQQDPFWTRDDIPVCLRSLKNVNLSALNPSI